MTTSYITLDGTKISIQYDTYEETTPAFATDYGLNGDAFQMIAARTGKHTIKFTAQVQDTPAAGYYSFSALAAIINSTTAASRTHTIVTPDGVTYTMLITNGNVRKGITSQVNGPTVEIYRIPMEMVEA